MYSRRPPLWYARTFLDLNKVAPTSLIMHASFRFSRVLVYNLLGNNVEGVGTKDSKPL